MPHTISFDANTVKPASQGELALGGRGPLSIVQQDGQTYYKGPDGQLLGPLGGEGVFTHQKAVGKSSVIVDDNHFKTVKRSDSITGGGYSIDIWEKSGPSTFDTNDADAFENNQAVEGMHDSVHCVSDITGLGGKTHITKTYEPIAEMNSFGETHDPVLEVCNQAGAVGTTLMTSRFGDNADQMISPLSGGDGCAF